MSIKSIHTKWLSKYAQHVETGQDRDDAILEGIIRNTFEAYSREVVKADEQGFVIFLPDFDMLANSIKQQLNAYGMKAPIRFQRRSR